MPGQVNACPLYYIAAKQWQNILEACTTTSNVTSKPSNITPTLTLTSTPNPVPNIRQKWANWLT